MKILKNYKILFTSVVIFLLTFIFMGLLYTKWGFIADDFGFIISVKTESFKDFFKFFYSSSIDLSYKPSNYVFEESSFMTVLYRPVAVSFLAIQRWFFGFAPYPYFLVLVFIHAINSAILFNILLFFTEYALALWGALFFAFHTSMFVWFGWICCQQYHINLMLFFLIILSLKKYFDMQLLKYYFAACFFFLVSVFVRETLLVFPLWMVPAAYLYENKWDFRIGDFLRNSFRYIKLSLMFWAISFFYLFVRVSFYPLSSNLKEAKIPLSLLELLKQFSGRGMQLVSFISDLFGFAWMPLGHQFIKGSFILMVFGIFLWLFIRNDRKFLILFSAFSLMFFLWPAILLYYNPRYLYISFPFFIIIILLSIKFYKFPSIQFKKKFTYILYAIAFFNFALSIFNMRAREFRMNLINTSFKNLVLEHRIKDRALCFIGIPVGGWFSQGVAQAVRIYEGGHEAPICHDLIWGVNTKRHLHKNLLDIKPINENGFRLTSKDPEELWFIGSRHASGRFSMGEFVIHSTGKVSDISFIFDKKWKDLLFITWDFEKDKFVFLDEVLK